MNPAGARSPRCAHRSETDSSEPRVRRTSSPLLTALVGVLMMATAVSAQTASAFLDPVEGGRWDVSPGSPLTFGSGRDGADLSECERVCAGGPGRTGLSRVVGAEPGGQRGGRAQRDREHHQRERRLEVVVEFVHGSRWPVLRHVGGGSGWTAGRAAVVPGRLRSSNSWNSSRSWNRNRTSGLGSACSARSPSCSSNSSSSPRQSGCGSTSYGSASTGEGGDAMLEVFTLGGGVRWGRRRELWTPTNSPSCRGAWMR